ncbi:MAG: HAD-IA family hydrolase [Desulfobacterales bacterium]|jgi:HAD superfamily hydrolase (TIGR01509 family)
MTKAVIFDMDGVMTDSEHLINKAAIAGLREYGIQPEPSDFLPFTGMGEDHYIGGVARKYGLTYIPQMKARVYEIYFDLIFGQLTAFPGVLDLLEQLRVKPIRLAVASCADRIKVEANLNAINVELGWFDVILTGDDVPNMKPAPDIYLAAAQKLAIDPKSCCVIEDSINGIRAAKSAGMRCVAVEQSFAASELQLASPDCIRSNVSSVSLADLSL